MNDTVFCSNSCRMSTAGASCARKETTIVEMAFACGKRKATPSFLDTLGTLDNAVRGASFVAHVRRLLSSGSFV